MSQVVDHYDNPRNVGSFQKGEANVGTGLVGAPACGDVMKLQIKVQPLQAGLSEHPDCAGPPEAPDVALVEAVSLAKWTQAPSWLWAAAIPASSSLLDILLVEAAWSSYVQV